MHIVIFHYHLQPGGVTEVITAMRRALLAHAPSVDRVTLVSGSEENVDAIRTAVESIEGSPPAIDILPEIGYKTRQSLARYDISRDSAPATGAGSGKTDGGETAIRGPVGQVDGESVARGSSELSRRIAATLLERYGGDGTIWWVHNHHLGKNPAFTRALYDVAAAHPEQRIVLHIHDFPECARYGNLRFLHAAGLEELYPDLPNLTWVVINSRDKRLLEKAGIKTVHYLPNPVDTRAMEFTERDERSPIASVDRGQIRRRLAHAFGTEFPMFDPEAPILLYPVRTIRRKNVLEAGLIAALLRAPANLVVTLPGVSHQEKNYSALVEHAYKEGLISGLWGIGRRLDEAGVSFDELQRGADAIISSSVQEGFGFQYIAPLLLGIPLIARRLDILADVEPLHADRPHVLYEEIRVPMTGPTLSAPQALLRFRYSERLDRLNNDLPETIIRRLEGELVSLLAGDTIEFSYLPAEMQLAILRDVVRDSAFRDEIRALNNTLIEHIAATITSSASSAKKRVDTSFGPTRFAEIAEEIIAKSTATGSTVIEGAANAGVGISSRTSTVESAMLATFADLRYQRLLYS